MNGATNAGSAPSHAEGQGCAPTDSETGDRQAPQTDGSLNGGKGLVDGTAADLVLVVSHACVVPENQSVYVELMDLDWDVCLVAPSEWRHEYSSSTLRAAPLPGLVGRMVAAPVILKGRAQRHSYLRGPGSLLAMNPRVLFLEEECFSLAAFQWARVAYRRGIPFGVQAAENLDRPLPAAVKSMRSWVLSRAAFVAARSPVAGELAQAWGAKGLVALVPHAVPPWPRVARTGEQGTFCVGFAGRLLPEKGVWDLVEAVKLLEAPIHLLLAGDGPLREDLRATALPNGEITVLAGLSHSEMAAAFGAMDVLVLPSRTTETWAEQFGRVLVEAMWCGVPVVGSDSGEIPWVIDTTKGGVTFPEGDVKALWGQLDALRNHPERRSELARAGREAVADQFSAAAAAASLDAVLRAISPAAARQQGGVSASSRSSRSSRIGHDVDGAFGKEVLRNNLTHYDSVSASPRGVVDLPAGGRTKVLLLSPSGVPGGAERALVGLARHLPEHGFDPLVVFLQRGPAEAWFREIGCAVTIIDSGRLRNANKAVQTIWKLSRLMRRLQVGAVVSNMDKGHIYGGLAARLAGISSIWWQQGIPQGGGMAAMAAKVPVAVIVCSSEEAIVAQERMTPNRLVTKIHLGSPVEAISKRRGSGVEVRKQLEWSDRPIVGIVGRLEAWKGHKVFLHSAALVAAKHPDTRFLVVGGALLGWEGDYPAELLELAKELHLEDKVKFVGHQSDVYPWFDAMDVVAHASIGEPFGLVTVEAMALGKAVVATASGGPVEIIEDGVSGLLVTPGDPVSMADAISTVLSNRTLATSIGQAAADRASAFSESRMAERFADTLQSLETVKRPFRGFETEARGGATH